MYRSPHARPRQVPVKAQQAHLTFSPTASVNHLHSGGLKSEKILTAPKIMSSVNNRWHPYHFYKNNLIAGGESVDSTTMEKQAEKIGRNVKKTDVGFWIDLATEAKKENNSLLEKMAAGMSFHCLQQNRLIRLQSKQNSEEKKNESEVLQQRGFFLDDASAQDETITLPNGKQFKITDIITVDDTSNWTSTKFDAHTRLLALKVFDVVAEFDTEFFAYSGKPKPLNYIYVGHDFFRIFASKLNFSYGSMK
uniref:Uncharacterized protein n=1 Tax=Caenorhabditis japonica TaxID=281687 RepID=A0A8R1HLX6_CAEJA